MPYASEQDIVDRYGEDTLYTLADKDNDDILDHQAINRALDDASEHINAFIAARYTLPLASTPTLLRRLCVDIAVYWLGEDRGGAVEERRQRFEDAERLLGKIAKGDVSLGMETTLTTSSGSACIISGNRFFSRDSLKGW